MPETKRFVDGETYHHTFPTELGWVAFVADVIVSGQKLTLANLLVEPMHTRSLELGPKFTLHLRREIKQKAKQEGYTMLNFDGVRLKAGRSDRAFFYKEEL